MMARCGFVMVPFNSRQTPRPLQGVAGRAIADIMFGQARGCRADVTERPVRHAPASHPRTALAGRCRLCIISQKEKKTYGGFSSGGLVRGWFARRRPRTPRRLIVKQDQRRPIAEARSVARYPAAVGTISRREGGSAENPVSFFGQTWGAVLSWVPRKEGNRAIWAQM